MTAKALDFSKDFLEGVISPSKKNKDELKKEKELQLAKQRLQDEYVA